MALTDEQLATLARRHNERAVALQQSSGAAMARLFGSTVTDPSDGARDRFVPRARALDAALRRQAAGAAAAYVATYEAGATGDYSGEPVDLDGVTRAVRGGADVWDRPIVRTRKLLADGLSLASALRKASEYAGNIQSVNTALAGRDASGIAMSSSRRIVGYRRVLDGDSCLFCTLASTQRYNVGALLPLHNSCGCTVAPIYGSADPGRVIDKALLDRLKGLEVKGDPEALYARTVTVREHGEYGPVLVPKGQHFTGPKQVNAA